MCLPINRKNKNILIAILVIFAFFCGAIFYREPRIVYGAAQQSSDSLRTGPSDSELKIEIGQMIMVGFRGTTAAANSDICNTIKDVGVGGVSLSDYDVPSQSFPRNIVSPAQTKQLIADLKKYSDIPLFMAVDAEGGSVNRLKPQYGFLPIDSPAQMGADKTLKTTDVESANIAEELKGLGFNMNFAPVVDVNINPKNPIIGALGRSFSADPQAVSNNAKVFILNHIKDDIVTVEKHFPGQGSATSDSHLGAVDVTNTYKNEELTPYQQLNNEGLLNAVMSAHIINRNVDAKNPATLSPAFLQDILRQQVGFKGVIISDDMQMGAITGNYSFDDSIVDAINAGVDIVYFFNNSAAGYDPKIAYKARDAIFNAVRSGKIEESRITESYDRIIALKKQFKIIDAGQASAAGAVAPAPAQAKNQSFELLGVSPSIDLGTALADADYASKFSGIRPAFLLGILQEELSLEKTDLCYLANFKTGQGVKAATGESKPRTMNPVRDIPEFLTITKELGKDPSKTLVTCPMSFGWGGAMGPADFIPSTWMQYRGRIEKITGAAADPWNIKDAFLAASLYLGDSGAKSQTRAGEWRAAMIYFSGSPNSKYAWYADGALARADKVKAEIQAMGK